MFKSILLFTFLFFTVSCFNINNLQGSKNKKGLSNSRPRQNQTDADHELQSAQLEEEKQQAKQKQQQIKQKKISDIALKLPFEVQKEDNITLNFSYNADNTTVNINPEPAGSTIQLKTPFDGALTLVNGGGFKITSNNGVAAILEVQENKLKSNFKTETMVKKGQPLGYSTGDISFFIEVDGDIYPICLDLSEIEHKSVTNSQSNLCK